jgi:SAM-dependent methyltransferase
MSTQSVPQLFDPVKTARAEARARRIGPETFLLDRLSEDLTERLAPVMRDFAAIYDFGTPEGAFGKALTKTHPKAALRQATVFPEAETQDLVVTGMVLHHVDDLPGYLARLRRALRPDGLLMAAFAGGDTLHELRTSLLEAESELRGSAGLRVFPMVDVRAGGQLLQRAGLALPVADSDRLTVRYDNLFALIRDLRAMGSTAVALHRPGQPPLTRAIIARAAQIYAERFSDADGRIRATFEIIWLSGWAPHESQQKPLKPGSAKTPLAEALAQIKSSRET